MSKYHRFLFKKFEGVSEYSTSDIQAKLLSVSHHGHVFCIGNDATFENLHRGFATDLVSNFKLTPKTLEARSGKIVRQDSLVMDVFDRYHMVPKKSLIKRLISIF